MSDVPQSDLFRWSTIDCSVILVLVGEWVVKFLLQRGGLLWAYLRSKRLEVGEVLRPFDRLLSNLKSSSCNDTPERYRLFYHGPGEVCR